MKVFTISSDSPEMGIVLSGGVVKVGEEGRGRKQVAVPLPEGSIIEDNMLVEVPSPDSAATVLCVRDFSGYRGTWTMTQQSGVKVIAEGFVAQGQAGAMGGGPEYLLSLRNGGSFRIEREGRLYGAPAIYEVRNTNGNITIVDVDAERETAAASSAWS